jgi:2-phosphoglycerate kinase
VHLQYIGKIDTRLFKEISQNIMTDDVVLTDKQREHIEQRHPKMLERYNQYFKEIIENPDYILKDNTRENTALILKTVQQKNASNKVIGNVNLVLRLAVEGEDINNKNSIITCIPIGKNRLKSYKNNGKIIYKRE